LDEFAKGLNRQYEQNSNSVCVVLLPRHCRAQWSLTFHNKLVCTGSYTTITNWRQI